MAGIAPVTERIKLYASTATLGPCRRRWSRGWRSRSTPWRLRALRREHRLGLGTGGGVPADGPLARRRALRAPLRPLRRVRDDHARALGARPEQLQGRPTSRWTTAASGRSPPTPIGGDRLRGTERPRDAVLRRAGRRPVHAVPGRQQPGRPHRGERPPPGRPAEQTGRDIGFVRAAHGHRGRDRRGGRDGQVEGLQRRGGRRRPRLDGRPGVTPGRDRGRRGHRAHDLPCPRGRSTSTWARWSAPTRRSPRCSTRRDRGAGDQGGIVLVFDDYPVGHRRVRREGDATHGSRKSGSR